ncbi:MAG: magnesium/cobalt transporter CorA [Candidatus Methanoperedenaceae archaeon]|nr:magnesium/cobalt transporter CorA [Candidatus Methanoperedenaceae archaeon]
MSRLFRKSKTVGLPPGTVVYTGDKKAEKIKITLIDYDEKQFQEREIINIEECFPFKDKPSVTWINIDGIHETGIIEKIGKHFQVHPLLMEDVVSTGQRPKLEDFESYLFIVLKMLYFNQDGKTIEAEQLSLILGDNFLISFQEREGDIFNPVRELLRKAKGRIRKSGADYLAYTLIDAVVDNYFIILEKLGENLEDIEDELVTEPAAETLMDIHNMKREMIFLRKSVWPLREVISSLERGQSAVIKEPTLIYLKDVYDHTIQVMDTIETFRDMVSGMLDIYLSSISNKMNEIMKVLTIIATIFIPLTFIAGLYGMNFEYMPELSWKWGYFAIWIVMIVIGASMMLYFRRKRWL